MRFLLVLGLATVPAIAHADRVLTLDDALALARANNRDLRVAQARLAQTAATVDIARAALLPNVSAQGKYTHNYKEVDLDLGQFTAPTSALADVIKGATTEPALAGAIAGYEQALAGQLAGQAPIVIQKEEQLDFGLTATVPLLAPASIESWSAAKLSQRANGASYDVTLATVLVGVAVAYYAAAGSDELVVARRHAVEVAKDTFDNAKARVAAEVANQVDVTRAETAFVRAEQDQAEAENSRGQAYRALATLLGTHETLTLKPAQPADAQPAAVDQLVGDARKSRPEFAVQHETIEAAAANARAAGWKWSPALSAFGNLRAFNYAGFSGDKYSWAVGLQLDWVLYDGSLRDAQRSQAHEQRVEAEARLDLLGDSVSDEIQNAIGTLGTKRRGVTSAQHTVELATETLRLVKAQYDAGTAKQLDVLQAQDSLVSAEVGLAQAHFDSSLADLQLRRASGEFPGVAKATR